ncbi:hypothetical protein [Chamaesiphon sp. OTE_75_metabat_556]|uniref:hypothetical protein n=1 Tax=Chamaesiphon sp. OTE_75_metabat_556 TaxID=2964692 RepID=UPI00286AB7F6|nr:hypothetical protein [Chamaesiphon sp. OTE_75_metabat_556]
MTTLASIRPSNLSYLPIAYTRSRANISIFSIDASFSTQLRTIGIDHLALDCQI